jgi:hypothetical protein
LSSADAPKFSSCSAKNFSLPALILSRITGEATCRFQPAEQTPGNQCDDAEGDEPDQNDNWRCVVQCRCAYSR